MTNTMAGGFQDPVRGHSDNLMLSPLCSEVLAVWKAKTKSSRAARDDLQQPTPYIEPYYIEWIHCAIYF